MSTRLADSITNVRPYRREHHDVHPRLALMVMLTITSSSHDNDQPSNLSPQYQPATLCQHQRANTSKYAVFIFLLYLNFF